MKKYELTNTTSSLSGRTLHRIRALKDFANVRAGDLGGWVESEDNLSQSGNCWVYNDAAVLHNARVQDNAKVSSDARVQNNAKVQGGAKISGDALISDHAIVAGSARIFDHATILGHACVFDNAQVSGYTIMFGCTKVLDYAQVSGCIMLFDYVTISGSACVSGSGVQLCDHVRVLGDAKVFGPIRLSGDAVIRGNALLSSKDSILWIPNIGRHHKTATFFACVDGKIGVDYNGHYGNIDEFAAVCEETPDNDHAYAVKNKREYRAAIELAKAHILFYDPPGKYKIP